jgi:hypothetical protein
MQTTSYRVLKWTLFAGFAASMATACVVTSNDGGDDIFDGGESGSSNNDAGKTSTQGGTSAGTGGKTSTGGGGSSTTAGTAGTTAAGGEGGNASTYVPGLCQADDPTPTMVPSCAPDDKDAKDACRKCMRASCCDEWQTCYGDSPKTACGWGPTETANSQFECIRECFDKGAATATDPDMLLADCGAGCAVQCDDADGGLIMDSTSALVECANTACSDECFPF